MLQRRYVMLVLMLCATVAMAIASESVMRRPVRCWNSTQAVSGKAIQTSRPPTRNFMSTASAWRVAMATTRAW